MNVKEIEKDAWRFENAVVTLDGKERPFKDAYKDTKVLLAHGTLSCDLSARNQFQAMIEQAPEFAEGHFQLARLELKLGDREAALKHAVNAAHIGFGTANYHIFLIALYCDAGKIDQAVAKVDSLIEDKPDDYSFSGELPSTPSLARVQGFLDRTLSRVLSQYIFYGGRLETKEHHVRQFIEDLNEPNQAEMAVGHAQAYLKNAPTFSELRFHLVKYLMEQARFSEAWESVRTGGEAFPKDWPCQILAGLACARNGEIEEAFNYFEQAALSNAKLPLFKPDNLDQQEKDQGIAWFEALVANLPGYAGAYHDGWVYPPLATKGALASSQENEGATLALALADIRETIVNPRGWIALARNDISSRYRRTVLGPWWIVLGTGLALSGMAVVWSMLFGMTMAEFFPYISSGYVTWMFISAVMMEGCNTFTGQAMAIMNTMPMSKTLHVARLVLRNFLIFVHTMAIFVVVALVYRVDVNANTLLVIPGAFLMVLAAPAVALLFGIIGLRYRDFGPALGAIMTVLFLLTPIMWKAEQLGTRGYLASFNPMTHFISIIRDPLLGHAPHILSYVIVGGVTIGLWTLALWALARARNRLVFWI